MKKQKGGAAQKNVQTAGNASRAAEKGPASALERLLAACPPLRDQFEAAAEGTDKPWADSLGTFILPYDTVVAPADPGEEDDDRVTWGTDGAVPKTLEESGFSIRKQKVEGLDKASNYLVTPPPGASLRFEGGTPNTSFRVLDAAGNQIAEIRDIQTEDKRLTILCVGNQRAKTSKIIDEIRIPSFRI